MGATSGYEIRECRAVFDPARFERDRFGRVRSLGGQAAGQQLDGLRECRLARVVGAYQKGQRGKLQLRPLRIALVVFNAESSEIHETVP